MSYTPKYDAFVRRYNVTEGRYENINVRDLPEEEFRSVMVDALCRTGVLVGMARDEQ